MDLLGRLLTGHGRPLRSRVAAAIVLLYAQPLSRVVRPHHRRVIHAGEQVLLRLGEPPSPVPGAVADLLLDWVENRDNMNTATNRDSRWLFPGRRAGQPMHADALAALVNRLGVPTVAGRTSAIRQHVLEMRPSWQMPSATTRSLPPSWPLRREAPGAVTPPDTTTSHHRAGLHGELTTVK